jgi:thiosulfate/3-mercaptopyruvate sulfurtransferase
MRRSKREWERAHVPGAAFDDLRKLCDPNAPPRTFTTPNADWCAAAMGRLRIGDGTRVVLPATFTPAPRPGLFVDKDDVLQAIDDPKACIVCALGRRHYRGERREYGRWRSHIPGTENVSA